MVTFELCWTMGFLILTSDKVICRCITVPFAVENDTEWICGFDVFHSNGFDLWAYVDDFVSSFTEEHRRDVCLFGINAAEHHRGSFPKHLAIWKQLDFIVGQVHLPYKKIYE